MRDGSRAQSPTIDRGPSPPASPRRRDFAPAWLSSSVWSQGGESYVEQYESAVGSPGQDLGRLTEGPARYLNGTPNMGSKAMLERSVNLSPRGRFTHAPKSGPAQHTQIIMDRKLDCKRSAVGPDPYGLCAANLWSPRPALRAYATFTPAHDTLRQPHILGRTASHAFDPYHVGSRNSWRHTSPSIKSIMAPPMPQTPHGSPLLPVNSPRTIASQQGQYSRMRASVGREARVALTFGDSSLRLAGGNPFH